MAMPDHNDPSSIGRVDDARLYLFEREPMNSQEAIAALDAGQLQVLTSYGWYGIQRSGETRRYPKKNLVVVPVWTGWTGRRRSTVLTWGDTGCYWCWGEKERQSQAELRIRPADFNPKNRMQ
jgi:hypothetical protein